MNQWGPGWDVHPQYTCPDPMCREPGTCMRKTNEHGYHVAPLAGDYLTDGVHPWAPEPPIRPDDYRVEAPGPYTSPAEPTAASRPPRYGWGTLITLAVLAALFIVGLAVSASRDDEVVQIPNTVLHPTPIPTATPTPARITPQAHKPGPPVRGVEEYMPEDGSYLLDVQVWPGTYSAVCAVEFCSWTRAEYVPELGIELGVASSETDPRKRPLIGDTVVVKILKTDSSFITQGFTSWVRS